MHKLYCVIGRTASGKSTISNEIAKITKKKVLKSYTTRAKRNNNDNDHIFINSEDVVNYPHKAAYTERVGYCSFATEEQLYENDIYLINPNGFVDLQNYIKTQGLDDIELISVMINMPYNMNKQMAKKRGDFDNWKLNYNAEEEEFKNIIGKNIIHYFVLNDGSVENSVKKFLKIIEKEES